MNDAAPDAYEPLKDLLEQLCPPLSLNSQPTNTKANISVFLDKPVLIEGRKRPYLDFAQLIAHQDYVGFYFMPIYYEPALIDALPANLKTHLAGKSCFHLKTLTPDMVQAIKTTLKFGLDYLKDQEYL